MMRNPAFLPHIPAAMSLTSRRHSLNHSNMARHIGRHAHGCVLLRCRHGSGRDLTWLTWHLWLREYRRVYADNTAPPPLPGEPPPDYTPPPGVTVPPGAQHSTPARKHSTQHSTVRSTPARKHSTQHSTVRSTPARKHRQLEPSVWWLCACVSRPTKLLFLQPLPLPLQVITGGICKSARLWQQHVWRLLLKGYGRAMARMQLLVRPAAWRCAFVLVRCGFITTTFITPIRLVLQPLARGNCLATPMPSSICTPPCCIAACQCASKQSPFSLPCKPPNCSSP
jgi:hypothetical protein